MSLKNNLDTLRHYHATYKNWLNVLKGVKNNNLPCEAILRADSKKVLIFNREQASLLSLGMEVDFDTEQQCLSFNYKGRKIFMHGADFDHGDIRGVFLNENYKFLVKEGGTVVDVGANIGDSPVYFAANGMNVIAVEPYPSNAELALINAGKNGLADKIKVLNSAVGGVVASVKVDSEVFPDKSSDLKQKESGVEIPVLTLDAILKNYRLEEIFLKMDCEGCEYDSLLGSSDATILKFSKIAMEYHHGPERIVDKLENLGYHVDYTVPRNTKNSHAEAENFREGFLYASRTI